MHFDKDMKKLMLTFKQKKLIKLKSPKKIFQKAVSSFN